MTADFNKLTFRRSNMFKRNKRLKTALVGALVLATAMPTFAATQSAQTAPITGKVSATDIVVTVPLKVGVVVDPNQSSRDNVYIKSDMPVVNSGSAITEVYVADITKTAGTQEFTQYNEKNWFDLSVEDTKKFVGFRVGEFDAATGTDPVKVTTIDPTWRLPEDHAGYKINYDIRTGLAIMEQTTMEFQIEFLCKLRADRN